MDKEGGAVLFNHWWEGVPAIPAALSDVVVIGEITDARSYLSNDKTGVYSEFTIRVDEVLKNSTGSNALSQGASLEADRDGGAVRFPIGRIKKYVTAGKGMPRVGARYVLFLKARQESKTTASSPATSCATASSCRLTARGRKKAAASLPSTGT